MASLDPNVKQYLAETFIWNLSNKIWWLCLVATKATRLASDVGYRMAKNLIGLHKENIFLWIVTSNSLTENEEHNIPSQILRTILELHT